MPCFRSTTDGPLKGERVIRAGRTRTSEFFGDAFYALAFVVYGHESSGGRLMRAFLLRLLI